MASIFGNFLKPFRGAPEPALALGAFGKHPGWDDHIEDFGLETEALLVARQLLYVQGIGGIIDSGAWEKLSPEESIPEFGHLLIWFGEGDLLVGRMWASRDRKGRARYPMVVCAHAANMNARRALQVILPELEKAEESCRKAATAADVESVLESLRKRLRSSLLTDPAATGAAPAADGRRQMAADLRLSPASDELLRILYGAETPLAAYGPGKVPDAGRRISLRLPGIAALPQQMRLPTEETKVGDVAIFWLDLLTCVAGASAPMLFLQPLGRPWMDVIVGCPGTKQLFCLRASAKSIPPLQEIPYNLPDGFREKAARMFQQFCDRV